MQPFLGNVEIYLIFFQWILEFLFISLFCYIFCIFSYCGIATVLWINLLGMHSDIALIPTITFTSFAFPSI